MCPLEYGVVSVMGLGDLAFEQYKIIFQSIGGDAHENEPNDSR